MSDLDILDDDRSSIEKRLAGRSNLMDRVRHFVVDFILILTSTLLIKEHLDKASIENYTNSFFLDFLLLILIYFAYYLVLEYFYRWTIGKLLNKTRVINEKYEKPSFKAVLIRAIIRPIPFQFALRLFPAKRTLHDHLSSTWVIRIN